MRTRTNTIRLPQHGTLIHEIVERSIIETRERLGANLAIMTAAELRGYVKARATAPVLMHTRQLMAEQRVNADCVAEVIEQSIERVTQSIVREAALPPVVSLPCAAVPMRAAA